ncbi:hypothetical protein GYMLUDRAFT_229544 [Collybiopsis luxurians FD-317 M1]|uniref:L-aminoadipate-semialdehyde dehydrogenase n=1 Tax=Collybiopsis luxurians FD-317 M1 TaxID=944289 RepID=A0A0D0B226_9AGAR|nr:hypothetical protein GYMLUDRAFT_229544 [Collybiopsis luxurians FD-317 M1]
MSSTKIVYPDLSLNAQPNLLDILDFNLEHNPSHTVFVFPNDAGGLTKISMLEYVRACHRAGNYVRASTQPGDVIGVIANVDTIVYSALIVGMIKAGLVPFPISPRNSPVAIFNLLKKTSAKKLVITETTLSNALRGLRAELKAADPSYKVDPSRIIEAPSLQEIYPKLGRETASDPFTPIPPVPTPEDHAMAVYLHSSGSTGLPKPIGFTHKILKDDAALTYMDDLRNFQAVKPSFTVGGIGLPSFHMMGLCSHMLFPLYGPVTTAVFAPAVTSPEANPTLGTPETVIECAKATNCDALTALPTFFNTWSQVEGAVDILRKMQFVTYGGGPLAHAIGENLVSRGVNINTAYGGTEFGVLTALRDDTKTWMYLKFSDLAKIRWSPQGDGTFEAQILETDRHHMAVQNLPDARGYATSDIFEPHPTVPNLWKIVGRLDDVIIHSSGEKTVPAPIEAIITASPLVHGAVMFGRQRDQPGILIELAPPHEPHENANEAEIAGLRSLIWPIVEEADKIAPAFSRIYKEMIIFTTSEKPLPRVGKGTVARKAALALYASEIDKLYETVASTVGVGDVEPPKSWEQEDLQPWLSEHITDLLSGKSLHPTDDLFEHGFDSLSATILRLRIVGALRKSQNPSVTAVAKDISQALVYSHPTIELLTRSIAGLISNPNAESLQKSHEQAMEDMIEKYSKGLNIPISQTTAVDEPRTQEYVLLTGSTGNLGAQMLESLLAKEEVKKVYTLNRPSSKASMTDRHRVRFEDKGLNVSLLSSPKLVYLEGETSHEDLGLSQEQLSELRGNVTMIIHNAWRLDFNLSLASFESHVKGSRTLIDFGRSTRRGSGLRFLFTSSIGSAQSWDARARGAYPEEVVMDAKYAVGGGYGESKYVTERILAKSGLQATSFRIGQVTGGEPNGAWATTDWVPIIVKSSLTLGMLPDAIGIVSWIPMDAVSDALLDIGFGTEQPPMAVNVVHPRPVSWTSLVQKLRKILMREKQLAADALRVVPYKQWAAKVEDFAKSPSEEDLKNVPAIKLIDFYRAQVTVDEALRKDGLERSESVGLTPLSTKNVERLSERVRNLGPLDEPVIEQWVKYWIAAGF